MGNCISTSCKRGRRRESVPQIQDTALPKGTSPNCPTPSHAANPCKDKLGQIQCVFPQKSNTESLDCSEEKRVLVHETVRAPHSSPARTPVRSLKENKNVNLSSQGFKPVRTFSGKPIDRQTHVGRRSRESTPTKPRPAASPSRGSELASSRKPDCVEPRTQKVPVKKQSFGELRSGSPSSRANRGFTSSGMKSGDSSKRANSSRRVGQIRGKDLACFEPQKLGQGVAEKPVNVCALPAELAGKPEIVPELSPKVSGKPKNVYELSPEVSGNPKNLCGLPADVAEKPENVCELAAEFAEEPTNMCELPTGIASIRDSEFDSTLPPVDLENPLISLDCFIFL